MRLLLIILCFWAINASGQRILVNGWKRVGAPAYTVDTVFVNFYQASGTLGFYYGAGKWNNLAIPTSGLGGDFFPLNTKTGTSSGLSIAWRLNDLVTRAITGYNDNDNGTQGSYTSVGNLTGFPDSTLRTGIYTTTNDTRVILSGCNDAYLYSFHLLATRNSTLNRTFSLSYGAQTTGFLEPIGNKTLTWNLNDMIPVSGLVTMDMDFTNGFAFMGAAMIIIKIPI